MPSKSVQRRTLEQLLSEATDPATKADLASRLAKVVENESRAAGRRRRARAAKPKPEPKPPANDDDFDWEPSPPAPLTEAGRRGAMPVPPPPPPVVEPEPELPVHPLTRPNGYGTTVTIPSPSLEEAGWLDALFGPPVAVTTDTWSRQKGVHSEYERAERAAQEAADQEYRRKMGWLR